MTGKLDQLIADLGAEMMNFGPPPDRGGLPVAETFGRYEAEYAAIRRRVGILHLPPRGRIQVTGGDRLEYLQRMLTQDVASLTAGRAARTFLLNEKGRIVADMIVIHEADQTVLDLDVFDAANVVGQLGDRVFTEDVNFTDVSDQFEHIALLGPAATALLHRLTGEKDQLLEPFEHRRVRLAGEPVLTYRRDDTGTLGLHLHLPATVAGRVYRELLDAAGFDPQAPLDADFAQVRRQSLRGRPIGWLAYNTARIEAGSVLFHIDFGIDSLPAETGILDQAVCFTKGCYLGQEIVARMKNLGHPKRLLVGLKFTGEKMPVAGSQVFADVGGRADSATVIGGITSSTLSPMLGHSPIALAVIKWNWHQHGNIVRVPCEGRMQPATISGPGFLNLTP